MPTKEEGRAPGNRENDPHTEEELLNAAVSETSEQASGKDEDEVEADLRSAMGARGLDPADTSSLASSIADAADEPS